jgi:hypothetical protein
MMRRGPNRLTEQTCSPSLAARGAAVARTGLPTTGVAAQAGLVWHDLQLPFSADLLLLRAHGIVAFRPVSRQLACCDAYSKVPPLARGWV